MRIAIHPSGQKIALLHDSKLELYSADNKLLTAVDLAASKRLAAWEQGVAVLTGKLSAAGASLSGAVVHRFSWDLAPLGMIKLGEVDRHGLSLSADGSRLAVTDWKKGQVTVLDATTGARLGGAGESIPSGASLSPDGAFAIAGTADQGEGAILFFEVHKAAGGKLPMHELPPPKSKIGLDDAPYFSAFSPDGRLAALSNESWGGRGLFVYDVEARRPLWSAALPSSGEEPEEWSPPLFTFAHQGKLLLVRYPGAVRAYRAVDGVKLGEIEAKGEGFDGLAADDHGLRVLLPGPQPIALPYPAAWTGEPSSPPEAVPGKPSEPAAAKASKPTTAKASKPTVAKASKPAAKTSKPAAKTSKPAAKTSKPAVKTSKPAVKTSKPAAKVGEKSATGKSTAKKAGAPQAPRKPTR
jgi:hypothetical protein